jgi:competence protein ComEC
VHDARLLLPAAAAWAGAALAFVLLEAGLTQSALVAALICIALMTSAVSWYLRTGLVAAIGVCLCIGAGAAGLQVLALNAAPVAGWVEGRHQVEVIGVISDEPFSRPVTGAPAWQGITRTTVRMATTAVERRGEQVEVELPITLLVDDPAAVPIPGSHVRVSGTFAPPGPLRHSAGTLKVTSAFEVVRGAGIIDRAAVAMRTGLRASIAHVAPNTGALVAGLAIGDESDAPPDLSEAMLGSGLSHLTAVSGGNVAIIVVVVLGATALLRLPMPARIVIALIALAFFVVLVRPQPSVLRASVMGAVVLAGMLTGGKRAGPAVLATSVLLLMVLSPHLAVAWGFSLSVAATAGLILIAPWVRTWLDTWSLTRRWPPVIRNGLSITGAAQLATLPLLVAMGGAVGWVALPANLLAMPAVVPVTIFGLLAALTAPWLAPLGVLFAWLAAPGAWWIGQVAFITSTMPGAKLPWPSGWIAAIALAPVFLALWCARRHLGLAIALTAGLLVVWTLAPPERRSWPPADWLMVTCDVGQGDAHVINLGDGAGLLIDTGPDPAAVDSCLSDLRIHTLAAVVLSHFHADHVGGLPGALRGRRVDHIFTSPLAEPVEQVEAVQRVTTDIPSAELTYGEVRTIGSATWQVLWPRRIIDAGSRPNNASVVLLVTIAGRNLLFTGDIEPEAQRAMLANLAPMHLDVVKVPHHGSRFQLPDLPIRTRARIAIFSVGIDNRYGHPADQTLFDWQRTGAIIGRTDEHGDLAITADLALVRRS